MQLGQGFVFLERSDSYVSNFSVVFDEVRRLDATL